MADGECTFILVFYTFKEIQTGLQE